LVFNVEENVEPARRGDVCVLGYVWGQPVDSLLRALSLEGIDIADAEAPRASFDLILLSDLIFNHSQVRHHHHLLSGQLKYIHIYVWGVCLFSLVEKSIALCSRRASALSHLPGACSSFSLTTDRISRNATWSSSIWLARAGGSAKRC
jgi:hypothetical protein